MSLWGQKAKYSLRADVVRSSPNNRHEASAAACPFGAKRRHARDLLQPLPGQEGDAAADRRLGPSERGRRIS